MRLAPFVLLLAFLGAPCAHATTWDETSVDDPIQPGAKCLVQEPMSSGGYIYWWPSKYDQVFWPVTERHGIWHCRTSGFTALIGDFEGMSAATVERVRAHLAQVYPKPVEDLSFDAEVALLEGIYALREPEAKRANLLLRALAYQYEAQGNLDRARQYRQRALPGIEAALHEDLPLAQRRAYLAVAAGYQREFGNVAASDAHLAALRLSIAAPAQQSGGDGAKDERTASEQEEEAAAAAEYFSQLIDEVKHIEPGGKLDPDVARMD